MSALKFGGPKRLWWLGLILGVLGIVFAVGALAGAFTLHSGLVGKVKAKFSSTETVEKLPSIVWKKRETGLATIETMEIPLGNMDGDTPGGSLVSVGDTVIIATGLGRIGYVNVKTGEIGYLDANVPMNIDGFVDNPLKDNLAFIKVRFRIHDALLLPKENDVYQYVIAHHYYDDEKICLRISSADLTMTDGIPELKTEFETRFQTHPCFDFDNFEAYGFNGHMSGGRLHHAEGNSVYLTVGDFGFNFETPEAGSEYDGEESHLTTLLKIDLDTGESEIVAEGMRNPQGLEVDDLGRIWTTEHGPQGGDEVNLVEPGKHYGWPKASMGVEYGGGHFVRQPIPASEVQGSHDGFEKPIYAFIPSIGVSQLIAIPSQSKAFSLWQGDLLVGSLRGQSLFRIRLEGERAVYAEPIPLKDRLRDIILLDDGRIAMFTAGKNLLMFRDPEVHRGQNESNAPILLSGYEAVKARETELADAVESSWGKKIFRLNCSLCHMLDGSSGVGPDILNVVGSEIGGQENYPYSPALADADGRWTRSNLKKFIADPASAGFKGSAMPPTPQIGKWEMEALLDFLEDEAPKLSGEK